MEEHVPDTGCQCWRAPLPWGTTVTHPKELSAAFRKHRERRGWEHCTWEEGAPVSRAAPDRKAKEAEGAPEALLSWPRSVLMPARASRSSHSLSPTSSAGLQSKARVHDQGRAESWDAGLRHTAWKQGRGYGNFQRAFQTPREGLNSWPTQLTGSSHLAGLIQEGVTGECWRPG